MLLPYILCFLTLLRGSNVACYRRSNGKDFGLPNGGSWPIVLKNPLAKPFTLAIWAIFCGFQLQVRQANWVFRSFHAILYSAGAAIPLRSCERLTSLASRRKF